MRSFIHNAIVLFSLIFFTACGGGKETKAKFVVGQSFALTNSGYDGGLTIYGKNLLTNETFAYSSLPNGGQNQIVLDLAKGPWSFGVVGWSSPTTGNLSGNVHCGSIDQVDLASDTQTINLAASSANCVTSAFASSTNISTPPSLNLKNLEFHICPKISTGTNSSTNTFCQNQNLNESLGDDIWGIKLRLHSKPLPGTSSQTVIESSCIPASTVGYFNLSSYKIPTKNLPISIVTFKNKNCSESESSNIFDFLYGLEADYSNTFDKLFAFPVSSENPKIFISSTRSRRQSSPLESLIPKITCSGGNSCSFIRTNPSFTDFVIYGGPGGSKSQFILSYNENCSSFSNFTTTGDLIFLMCKDRRGGGAIIEVSTTNTGDCETTNCTLSYDHNSSTVTKSIKALVPQQHEVVRQQEKIIRLLGIENTSYSNPLVFSLAHLDNIRRSTGILHDIGEMFSSHGPAGAFSDVANCSNLSGVRFLDVFEEGIYKRFQVEISSIAESAPRQICSPTELNSSGICSYTLDKKMILREPVSNIFKATEVIKFDCDYKVGYSESNWIESESNGSRTEKRIIYWNSISEPQARVQEYSYEQKSDLSNQITRVRTQFLNINRGAYTVDSNSLLVTDSNYEYYFDTISNTRSERVSREEFALHSDNNYYVNKKTYYNTATASVGEIFTMPEIEQFFKEKSVQKYQTSTSGPDLIKSATSANGTYHLIVSFDTGGNFTYKIYTGSNVKKGTGSTGVSFSSADISINNSGKAIIAFSTQSDIKFFTIDASLSSPTISTEIDPFFIVAMNTSRKIQAYIGNDNLITLAAVNDGNKVNLKIVTLTGSIPSGNFSNGFDYTSSFEVDDFIARHINQNSANLCFTSSANLKCLKVLFPSQVSSTANFIITGGPSGTLDPVIQANSFSGSSFELFRDSSCNYSISSPNPISGSSSITTVGLILGFNDIFYKLNSGACNPAGISYFKSATGPYEGSITTPPIPANALSKIATTESSDLSFNVIDGNYSKKMSFNGTSISVASTSGASLSVYHTSEMHSKTSSVLDAPTAVDPGDIDQDDVPIKYPLYDGSLSGLKPQTYINLFTPSSTFSGQ